MEMVLVVETLTIANGANITIDSINPLSDSSKKIDTWRQ